MTKVINFRKRKAIKLKPVIHKNKKENFSMLYNERYKIIFLVISVLAILLGALCFRMTSNSQLSKIIVESFTTLNSTNFKFIFLYLLKLDSIYFIISFFIGTSFIGSVLSFIPPTIKCLYIGYLSGYLYNEFELKGVLFCLLLLYPCFAITTTALIFASNENVYMSQYIYNCLNGKNSTDNISIRLYLLRYILLFTIVLSCITVTAFLISFIGPKLNII